MLLLILVCGMPLYPHNISSLYVLKLGMITESDVIVQDSVNTSTVTVLASTFGSISFVILIIIVALILVAYSIRRAKCTRNMCSTSRDQNNSESKV